MLAKGLAPILSVSNMQESFAWFGKLGWQKGWESGADGHVFRVSQGEDH